MLHWSLGFLFVGALCERLHHGPEHLRELRIVGLAERLGLSPLGSVLSAKPMFGRR